MAKKKTFYDPSLGKPFEVELDPDGPKLEVTGPILEYEEEKTKAPHKVFMAQQPSFSNAQAARKAEKLGWTPAQIEALMEIRHGRGHWC